VRLVALIVVLSFLYGLASCPYFFIRQVRIDAPDTHLAEQALARVSVPAGASALLYPVQRIASTLEQCPQIRRARVERELPSSLVVHVWRREPIAAMQIGQQYALVDEQGVCVGTSPTWPESLIQVFGLLADPMAPGDRLSQRHLALLADILAAVPGRSLTRGLVMDFSDPHLIQIHSPSGVLGKLGDADNLKRKMMMFVTIMQQLEEKGKRPAYIDVRIMDRPVWKPRVRS